MGSLVDEILFFIFENHDDEFATQFRAWLSESRQFRVFAEAYREKIRKKLRVARDEETRRDLWRELEVAYRLTAERRFMIAYETTGASRRGPDFSVTFRTHVVFHVEVKRIRATEQGKAPDGVDSEKLSKVVCDAAGQFLPGEPNVLLMFVEGGRLQPRDVPAAMRTLKERAERKEEEFFVRRGVESARDFLKLYLRLSAVLAYSAHKENSIEDAVFWLNKEARRPLPSDVSRILQSLPA